MSNHLVGPVYQSIIDEVISSSRIDFEEAGVNASTLDDLKKVWQAKLSDLKVAHFPWDPPVETTTPAQIQVQQRGQAPQQQQPRIKPDPNGPHPGMVQNGGIRIKAEPGLENQQVYQQQAPPPIPGNPTHDPHLAAMRAQQNIAQKFGPQIQARPPGGLVLPGMNAVQQQQQQQPRPGPSNGIAQHDGADDEIPVEGLGTLTREEADHILLKRINNAERQSAKATEELAAALQNLKTSDKGKGKAKKGKRRARRMDAYEAALDPNTSYPYPSTTPSTSVPVPQMDAPGDSEDDVADEDAINSDLDDPEDDEIDNDEDDEAPQIMLCMYDKVQRTKNKWKCVLKDGVLTINGNEYVFHKANGEYEW